MVFGPLSWHYKVFCRSETISSRFSILTLALAAALSTSHPWWAAAYLALKVMLSCWCPNIGWRHWDIHLGRVVRQRCGAPETMRRSKKQQGKQPLPGKKRQGGWSGRLKRSSGRRHWLGRRKQGLQRGLSGLRYRCFGPLVLIPFWDHCGLSCWFHCWSMLY